MVRSLMTVAKVCRPKYSFYTSTAIEILIKISIHIYDRACYIFGILCRANFTTYIRAILAFQRAEGAEWNGKCVSSICSSSEEQTARSSTEAFTSGSQLVSILVRSPWDKIYDRITMSETRSNIGQLYDTEGYGLIKLCRWRIIVNSSNAENIITYSKVY